MKPDGHEEGLEKREKNNPKTSKEELLIELTNEYPIEEITGKGGLEKIERFLYKNSKIPEVQKEQSSGST